ncbi:MAG: 2-amino-4-hydroxy-6-hydroxymethyldihydropteridine diphosphokinase [Paracoccaceae bacterium]
MNDKACALIALGANLPLGTSSPQRTIAAALEKLDATAVEVKSQSRLFKTPSFPKGSGPDYVNAAAVLEVPPGMSAEVLLQHLHRIEARFGRSRDMRWGARTLDIDLLAFGDQIMPDAATQTAWRDLPLPDQARLTPPELILPHPRIQDRAFVLVPLADVAADWMHPILRVNVLQMLESLSPQDREAVQVIA